MPHHVVLLGRDPSLAIALQALLEHAGDVSALEVVDDWRASSAEEVDAVIVDLPTRRRLPTVERIRDGYRGRLVLLLDPTDDPAAVPSAHGCMILRRPFEIGTLFSLVAGSPGAPPRPRRQAALGSTRAAGAGEPPRQAPTEHPGSPAEPTRAWRGRRGPRPPGRGGTSRRRRG